MMTSFIQIKKRIQNFDTPIKIPCVNVNKQENNFVKNLKMTKNPIG